MVGLSPVLRYTELSSWALPLSLVDAMPTAAAPGQHLNSLKTHLLLLGPAAFSHAH
jgi:hypothetical protein